MTEDGNPARSRPGSTQAGWIEPDAGQGRDSLIGEPRRAADGRLERGLRSRARHRRPARLPGRPAVAEARGTCILFAIQRMGRGQRDRPHACGRFCLQVRHDRGNAPADLCASVSNSRRPRSSSVCAARRQVSSSTRWAAPARSIGASSRLSGAGSLALRSPATAAPKTIWPSSPRSPRAAARRRAGRRHGMLRRRRGDRRSLDRSSAQSRRRGLRHRRRGARPRRARGF